MLEYKGDIVPKEFVEGDKRLIKVNLPDSVESYERGNGEGVWAYILNEEDIEKYDKGQEKFDVILLNHSVYFMGTLKWGHVVQVEGRGEFNRPVMDLIWLEDRLIEDVYKNIKGATS